MNSVYELTQVAKVYDHRTVLDIPVLALEEEHIYALLGPNGAGKTTLLNILGFLDHPSRGSIRYCSKPVRFIESELQALRRDVVMVDQHPILFTTTVYKNLEFGLKVRKIAKKERARIIMEALDLVGMRDFAFAPAHRLSGGETQRVALARVLALSPKVFLCDEPTSSVDVENQAIILNVLRQINETKKMTIVFTTHDRTQASQIAHHTLGLDHGRLIKAGYENIFAAVVHLDSSGEKHYVLHPGVSLQMLSQDRHSANTKVKIFIDPNQIQPCADKMALDGDNILQGYVRQVMAENTGVRIVVDAGVWITLMMTENRYRQSRILVGDKLLCYVPPKAVQVIG
ncbi:ABC transporter ATP-binding protein [Thermodesulfobacteriota bacterium]